MENILNSILVKKITANLCFGYEKEKRRSALMEFNFIDELPLKQSKIFHLLFLNSEYKTKASFALVLINSSNK